MVDAKWTLSFGEQALYPKGSEFYCLITDELGDPVDTFYGADPQFMFEEVAALLESHATGTGLGVPVRENAGVDDA